MCRTCTCHKADTLKINTHKYQSAAHSASRPAAHTGLCDGCTLSLARAELVITAASVSAETKREC